MNRAEVGIRGWAWIVPGGVSPEAFLPGEACPRPNTELLRGDDPRAPGWHVLRVGEAQLQQAAKIKRLRRSGRLALMAVEATIEAIRDAELTPRELAGERAALVFAIGNGEVEYTRRFYSGFLDDGPGKASPLLFPETVFNAPAGHVAAALSMDGPAYTMVGDNTVGFTALALGCDLLRINAVDTVVLCGAEETDWILCDAFARLMPVSQERRQGMIPSEGAAAMVLSREGKVQVSCIATARYRHCFGMKEAMSACWAEVTSGSGVQPGNETPLLISGRNGTRPDHAESVCRPVGSVITPKQSLGEAPGASAIWQLIVGAAALQTGLAAECIAACAGFSHQAAAARLSSI